MSAPDGSPWKVAVVAHRRKTLGGGLDELRKLIAEEHVDDVRWYEVDKSRRAPAKVRRALKKGARLVFVWGGDGMVQRCVDVLAGTGADLAVLPAGTANLFAGSLGVPRDLPEAVRIGFHGARRRLDLGKVNGEHFAVMAGAGFDGELIHAAGRRLKQRAGRLAYLLTGLRHVGDGGLPTRIRVDGTRWFDGRASCVLLGNVGTLGGGVEAFPDARPDDGWLEVGVATAEGALQWARTLSRLATGEPDRSPFVRTTRARRVDVRVHGRVRYELDGGARGTVRRLKARVVPSAVSVCVPDA